MKLALALITVPWAVMLCFEDVRAWLTGRAAPALFDGECHEPCTGRVCCTAQD